MNLSDKLSEIRTQLKSIFVSKEDFIDVVVVALVSKQHVIVFGPPGTAKSSMADHFASAIKGSKIFNIQLNGDTHPDELLGPLSIKSLVEEEAYKRNTKGYLPDCQIALVDEIFSGNSIVVESLRGILNERRIFNEGKIIECPLITMIAGSNEQPESPEDSIFDRFVFRMRSDYLRTEDEIKEMLIGKKIDLTTFITVKELIEFQKKSADIIIPESVMDNIVEINTQLKEEGSLSKLSDRRLFQIGGDMWKGQKVSSVVKAVAMLKGKTEVEKEDLEILKHCCWSKFSEVSRAQQIVMRNVDTYATAIIKLSETLVEFCGNIGTGLLGNDQINAFCVELDRAFRLYSKTPDHPKSSELLKQIKTGVLSAKNAVQKSINIDKGAATAQVTNLENMIRSK